MSETSTQRQDLLNKVYFAPALIKQCLIEIQEEDSGLETISHYLLEILGMV